MFGIGMTEIVVILVIALLIFGPNKLPELARSLGRGFGEFRRASYDLRQSLMEATDLEPPPRTESARAPAKPDQADAPRPPADAPSPSASGDPSQPAPDAPSPSAPDAQSQSEPDTPSQSDPDATPESRHAAAPSDAPPDDPTRNG